MGSVPVALFVLAGAGVFPTMRGVDRAQLQDLLRLRLAKARDRIAAPRARKQEAVRPSTPNPLPGKCTNPWFPSSPVIGHHRSAGMTFLKEDGIYPNSSSVWPSH